VNLPSNARDRVTGVHPQRGVLRRKAFGRVARLTAVVALAAAGAVASGAAAFAGDPLPVAGVVVGDGNGVVRQAVQISRLYPGAQQQAVFLLDGADPAKARRMEIGVTSLSDFENGCIHPESGSGDTTCGAGAGAGELSRFLDLTLVAGREGIVGGGRSCAPVGAVVHTSLSGLKQQPVVVGLPDDVGVLCVVATFAHRDAVGDNVTQTDDVRFDLRLRFDTLTVGPVVPGPNPSPTTDEPGSGVGGGGTGPSPDDGTEVEGVKHEQPVVVDGVHHGQVAFDALPRTGLPVEELLFGAALLIGAGTVMIVVVRARRRPTSEVA
jgi:hypothetical protein